MAEDGEPSSLRNAHQEQRDKGGKRKTQASDAKQWMMDPLFPDPQQDQRHGERNDIDPGQKIIRIHLNVSPLIKIV